MPTTRDTTQPLSDTLEALQTLCQSNSAIHGLPHDYTSVRAGFFGSKASARQRTTAIQSTWQKNADTTNAIMKHGKLNTTQLAHLNASLTLLRSRRKLKQVPELKQVDKLPIDSRFGIKDLHKINLAKLTTQLNKAIKSLTRSIVDIDTKITQFNNILATTQATYDARYAGIHAIPALLHDLALYEIKTEVSDAVYSDVYEMPELSNAQREAIAQHRYNSRTQEHTIGDTQFSDKHYQAIKLDLTLNYKLLACDKNLYTITAIRARRNRDKKTSMQDALCGLHAIKYQFDALMLTPTMRLSPQDILNCLKGAATSASTPSVAANEDKTSQRDGYQPLSR